MPQEKEAKVRLDVETTGEPQAVQDVAEDLADVQEAVDGINVEGAAGDLSELGDAAAAAGGQAAELAGQAEPLADVLGEAAEGARDAGGAAGEMGDSWLGAGQKMAAGIEIGKLAIQWTQQITDGMNGLMKALGGTGKEFERMGPAIVPIASFEAWATALTDVNLLLDQHTGKLEESIRKHEEARTAFLARREELVAQGEAQADLNAKTQEFLAGLDLSKEKLQQQADELRGVIENVLTNYPDVDPQALARKVEPQITALVAKFQEAGLQLDPALQAIITKLGLVAPAADTMATGVGTAVASLVGALSDGKIDAAIQAIIDKFDLLPTAAQAAAEQTVAKLNLIAEEAERLDQIRVESARRTAEELKALGEERVGWARQTNEELAAVDAERAAAEAKRVEDAKAKAAELQAEAERVAAEQQALIGGAIAAAQQQTQAWLDFIAKISASQPDTSGIVEVRNVLDTIPPAAAAAAAGIAEVMNIHPNDAVLSGETPGLGKTPRYTPDGGFLTRDTGFG